MVRHGALELVVADDNKPSLSVDGDVHNTHDRKIVLRRRDEQEPLCSPAVF